MDLRSGKEPECDWRSSREDPFGTKQTLTHIHIHPSTPRVIFTKRSRKRPLGPNRRFHTHSVIFTKAQEKGPLGLWLKVKEHFVDKGFNHTALMLQRPSLTFWKYRYIYIYIYFFAKWLERKHLTVSSCRTPIFFYFHNCQLVKYGKTYVSLYFLLGTEDRARTICVIACEEETPCCQQVIDTSRLMDWYQS